jgi:hypothetical protein
VHDVLRQPVVEKAQQHIRRDVDAGLEVLRMATT